MPAKDFNKLWKSIDILEAQEHISLLRAITYPKLNRSAKAERNKKLQAAAYPRDIYKRESKDVSFLLNKLGGPRGRQ